jgi:hypothetical protein
MPERSSARIQVWNHLAKLQLAALGHVVRVSDQRDKFTLDCSHVAAGRLSDRPDANGFIRSDKNSLLFREASELFRQAVPSHIRTRAMASKKGLEFRWTQLEPTHIDELFAAVRRIAEISDQRFAVPESKVQEIRVSRKSESPVKKETLGKTLKVTPALSQSLDDFRRQISALMGSEYERSFVCDGSPLTCLIFIEVLECIDRFRKKGMVR